MNKLYLLILLGLLSCSASREIAKEEVKIEQKQIEVEGKEYALSDIDFNYEDEELIVIDTVISVVKDSLTIEKPKIKVKVYKSKKKADIELITPTVFISIPDTTKTIVVKQEDNKSEFKFWGFMILGFLVLLAIVLFIWKSR